MRRRHTRFHHADVPTPVSARRRQACSALRPFARHGVAAAALCALATLSLGGCGNEVIVYDALYLDISSEAPDGGPITRLDLAVVGFNAEGAAVYRLPETAGDDKFSFPLPATIDLVNKHYVVKIQTGTQAVTRLQLRVRGLDDKLAVLSAYSGVVDAPADDRNVAIKLLRIDAGCDADGDGVKDCAKDGCCVAGEAADCDDNAPTASPFELEDPCTGCGNNIDEDCDGSDVACVDADKDGVPDCQEVQCGPGAAADETIYPGAPELCDDKDNDCDGKVDEDLPYVGVDGKAGAVAKGASCGAGLCAGGTAVCSADAKGLVCSTADKKKDAEDCGNQADDDCNGKVNDGCTLTDIDGDGVPNADEDEKCANPYARFHAEIYPENTNPEACCVAYTQLILEKDPSWTDKDPIPGAAVVTQELLAACDANCDNAVKPCAPKDKDGDGVAAPLDCDDNDPMTYPGAKEKCGDGKVQGCVGADPACDAAKDADNDQWHLPDDCDDADPNVHPGAAEVCNGVDDDCDGIVDDGNPEANDAPCGDKDGECGKKPGVSVCKHWPAGQDPGALDCLAKPFDKASLTCVGCEGDGRPVDETCDYLDNDCDGSSDEDFTYVEEGSGKSLAIGASCNGVGACGDGKVECRIAGDAAVCSTDPEGSKSGAKPELCDNQDNDCNGQTDENLTTISDSTCHKAGVCSGSAVAQILTVCMAGKWVCDYTKIAGIEFDSKKSCNPGDAFCHCPGLGNGGKKCFPLIEATCEGKDNDCDGKTDDDFSYDDLGTIRKVGDVCGSGACAGGLTVCKTDGSGLTCSALGNFKYEACDGKDNDCNGQTDDGLTVADSSCKLVGECSPQNVKATCEGGKWVCDYKNVTSYEPLKEATCDGKDNDCDGKIDEDFTFDDLGTIRTIGQSCGTGVCAGGNVVCTNDKKSMTCSTLFKSATDVCDGKDNDCDGKTDEDYAWFGTAVGVQCDGIGACGKGVVECVTGKTDSVTCSTNPDGSKPENKTERCNDIDDDCDGKTDEGCDDDDDDFCDAAIPTDGKPKTCTKGGGDCQDDVIDINPGVNEICDGKDQDCNGKTDEVFKIDEKNEATGKTTSLVVGQSCGLGVCAGGKVSCVSESYAACSTAANAGTEVCDDKDNDCDGLTDEGCDDDDDNYCDAKMTTVGKPKTCTNGGGDCNDDVKTIHPDNTEQCNDIDDDCSGQTDEGCDVDGDGWCSEAKITVGKPKVCPQGGGDCNDDASGGDKVNPGAADVCNDIDDNCSSKTDEGCDDDKDGYCDAAKVTVGKPKTCPQGGGDCDDEVKEVSPGGTELCNDVDDDCSGKTDEGCDDDGDGYCDDTFTTVNKPKTCPKGGGDCDDGKDGKLINPGAGEICDTIDNDCNGKTDADDPTELAKSAPTCEQQKGVCSGLKKATSLCADGKWKACSTAYYYSSIATYEGSTEKTCDDKDNNCDGSVDEGCDDDGDGYCDDSMSIADGAKPKVCPNGGGDCNDKKDAKGPKINPGAQESCLTSEDDNCNGTNTEPDAISCVDFYFDGDKDGWGSSAKPKLCLCKANTDLLYTATQVGDCNDNSSAESTYIYDDPKAGKIELGGSCGSGACKGGTVVCSGAKASCSTGNKQSTEICNGLDDDCNGATDDKPDLSGEACSSKGVCKGQSAAKSCDKGKVVCDFSAVKDYEATETTCDNKDNDCDGDTDESVDFGSFTCATKGICKTSGVTPTCKSGTPTCDYSKVSGWQATENKCDGVDNDCDGTTDEDPDLSALTCASKGVCAAAEASSLKKCTAGKATCDYSAVADYEDVEVSCDNKDNDCDGKTDGIQDVTKSNCKLVGVCSKTNVQALCTAGNWVCDYQSVPSYEADEATCDSKDNDCDGTTDEGC